MINHHILWLTITILYILLCPCPSLDWWRIEVGNGMQRWFPWIFHDFRLVLGLGGCEETRDNSMENHGASWKINEDHVCFSGCPTLSASWGWLWRAAFFKPTESGIWTQHDPTLLEENIIIATGFLLPVSSSRGPLVASAGVVNLKGEGFWEPPSARSFGWFLMMSEDFWWCPKILDDAWRFLLMFEDFEDTHKTGGMEA